MQSGFLRPKVVCALSSALYWKIFCSESVAETDAGEVKKFGRCGGEAYSAVTVLLVGMKHT